MNNFPTENQQTKLRIARYNVAIKDLDDTNGALLLDLQIKNNFIAAISRDNVFYSQTAQLCQFIECDEEGKPIEEPIEPSWGCEDNHSTYKSGMKRYDAEEEAYEAAKKRVLFHGWEIKSYNNATNWEVTNGIRGIYSKDGKIMTTCIRAERLKTVYDVTNCAVISFTASQSAKETIALPVNEPANA